MDGRERETERERERESTLSLSWELPMRRLGAGVFWDWLLRGIFVQEQQDCSGENDDDNTPAHADTPSDGVGEWFSDGICVELCQIDDQGNHEQQIREEIKVHPGAEHHEPPFERTAESNEDDDEGNEEENFAEDDQEINAWQPTKFSVD